ncbi:FHA domain-containing protein, partial [archaeon]
MAWAMSELMSGSKSVCASSAAFTASGVRPPAAAAVSTARRTKSRHWVHLSTVATSAASVPGGSCGGGTLALPVHRARMRRCAGAGARAAHSFRQATEDRNAGGAHNKASSMSSSHSTKACESARAHVRVQERYTRAGSHPRGEYNVRPHALRRRTYTRSAHRERGTCVLPPHSPTHLLAHAHAHAHAHSLHSTPLARRTPWLSPFPRSCNGMCCSQCCAPSPAHARATATCGATTTVVCNCVSVCSFVCARPACRACMPPSGAPHWTLLVKKGGEVLDAIPLSTQPLTILGRNRAMSHVALDHASISRQHAALAFDASGELSLVDMGSSHGTFVGDARLA